MSSPKSLANLKPWPKGVSGNPAGRSKESRQSEFKLDKLTPQTVEIVAKALAAGDLDAAQWLLERRTKKVPEEREVRIEQVRSSISFVHPDGTTETQTMDPLSAKQQEFLQSRDA